MDIQEVCQALSNPTRLHLVQIISESPRSSAEAHRAYVKSYDDLQRESVYRELENLVDASILEKSYNNNGKKIEYSLNTEIISINLREGTITLE